MTALLALIRKDLLLYLGDRRAWMLNLLMPIVLGAFFGYLFGGNKAPSTAKIDIAVVALDSSELTQKLVADLQTDATLRVQTLPLDAAKALVLKGKIKAAVVLPEGFGDAAGAALFGGRSKPELPIYYDPSQGMVLAMVKGILTQHIMQDVGASMLGGAGSLKLIDKSLADLDQQTAPTAQQKQLRDFLHSARGLQQSNASSATGGTSAGGGMSVPFTTQDVSLTSGPAYNGYAHSFGGMAVQFILFMGIEAGISVLLARRLGLWNRLLAAPIGMRTVLGARGLSSAIIAMGLLLAIFAVAYVVFDVQIGGSLLGFLGVCLSFALFTASFGLVIAAFGKTPEAARSIATFATLIMVMLGGAWVPSFVFPQWLQDVAVILPTRWTVDGLDAMTWRGLGFDAAVAPILVQLAFTAVLAWLALWKFGRDSR